LASSASCKNHPHELLVVAQDRSKLGRDLAQHVRGRFVALGRSKAPQLGHEVASLQGGV